MRRAVFGLALCAGVLPGLAIAHPASLAVRATVAPEIPAAATDAATAIAARNRLATANFAAALAALPVPPRTLRSVLAAAPEPVTSKAGLGAALQQALAAPGAAASHPFATWFVLDFDTETARDRARAVLASRYPNLVTEPIRDLHCSVERPAATPHLADPPWNVQQVRAPDALAQVSPDSTLLVAVIDTGADLQHPDLVRRLWRNADPPGNASAADDGIDQNGDGVVEAWERDDDDDNGYVDDEHGFDFTDAPGTGALGDGLDRDADPSDDEGHGTHVAGLVAADGSVPGVAPFVQLMPVRAAYTTAFGGILQTDDAAAAVIYAVDNGARILNLSWGDREESVLIREAVAYAVQRGALVVAAAGNSGNDALHWPSGEPGVLAVGSVRADDRRSSFSNFGPGVPLYAPGERAPGSGGGILGLAPGGGYTMLRGTSMAAPHVSGVAAIVMSRADHPDAARTRSLLLSSARLPADAEAGTDLGAGVVDALAAVQSAAPAIELRIDGPSRPQANGRIVLHGTVAGGDVGRWRADARTRDGSRTRELAAWRSQRIVAGTLVDTDIAAVADLPDGDCEIVITAETGAGVQRQARVPFRLDRVPPAADTLFAAAAWRGAEPRWLVSVAATEEVGLTIASLSRPASEAGLAQRIQLEGAAPPVAPPELRVVLRDGAGLETDTTIAAPPSLPAWPRTGRLVGRDATPGFLPESVAGTGPAGTAVVWGSGLVGDSLTTVQAWGASAGRLALLYDTQLPGRPAGYADTNGDGSADLLLQNRAGIVWLLTRGAGVFPDSVPARSRAERALGFFQLDDDPAAETLLSSRDSLYLYDDAVGRAPRLLQALANPVPVGFDVFGADAASGDLDGDGRLEIACGDAEGNVAIFERTPAGNWIPDLSVDTGGTYAYDMTALGGGFVCGRQRTASVTGDGFGTALYEFLVYEPGGGNFHVTTSYPFLAAENDLRAGSALVTSPASGDVWLALVRGADLYLLRGPSPAAAGLELVSQQSGAAGEPPALLDLDADGRLDVVLRTATGAAWWTLDEGSAGPHDLRLESLGEDRLQLTWQPGGADTVRVQRAASAVWQTIATTTDSIWIDTTLQPRTPYAYRIEALRAGVPAGSSNIVHGQARALPRLYGLEPLGTASIRVRCTNPLAAAGLETAHWRVLSPAARRITGVALAEAGREVQLLFDAPVGCGSVVVEALQLRDDQGGRLQGAAAQASAVLPCSTAAFAVARTAIEAGVVVVEFSRAVDPATLAPERFDLRWNGTPVVIASVHSLDPLRVRLQPAAGQSFVGIGIPYLLRISAAVRAASDGAELTFPGTEYVLRVAGAGATAVVPAPNPVRAGDSQVTFAGAGPATRIDIFTLEGERVRGLEGAVGGGLVWDLRDGAGRAVASGAYIYIARDATGSRRGQVVLIR